MNCRTNALTRPDFRRAMESAERGLLSPLRGAAREPATNDKL